MGNSVQDKINRSNARIKKQFDRSLERTAKSVDNTNKQIEKAFIPVGNDFKQAFSKANMEKVDDYLVTNLKDAGRVLNTVGSIGDKVLNNPIAQLAGNIPVVGTVISGLKVGNSVIKAGGSLYDGLGNIIDRKAYDGKNGVQVATNVLEKTIKTGENIAGSGIKFA